jgi:carboxymethylenebutenolidase
MSSAQQVWRSYLDAWNRHDVEAILDSVTEDFIYDERPATMDRPLRGRSAFRVYLRTFNAFPDLRIDVTSCDAGSALAVSESIMRGTHLGKLGGLPATRRRITARVACVFEVRNGKLAHERLYWDRANTLRQLGRLVTLVAVALRPPLSEAALLQAVDTGQTGVSDEGT